MIPHDQDFFSDPGPYGSTEIRSESFSKRQAELLSQEATRKDMEMDMEKEKQDKEDSSKGLMTEGKGIHAQGTEGMAPLPTPPTPIVHVISPLDNQHSSKPSTTSMVSDQGTPTVTPKRRLAAPTSIPHFPSPNEARVPAPQIPHSPARSAASRSSPFSPPTPSNRPMSIAMPSSSGGMISPWHTLAASSGAPTPAIDDIPGRGSPHLGYPFERLNIGGSWSGANLWSEQPIDQEGRGSTSDTEMAPPSTVSSPPTQPSAIGPGGMSMETLARYRAMAGKASSVGSGMVKTKVKEPSTSGPESAAPSKPPLPEALAKRRASLPKGGLGALTAGPKVPSPLTNSSNSTGTSSTATTSSKLQPLTASVLHSMLSSHSILLLDVRPPSSYAASHLPLAHNLPIPSTLLRRPAFNIAKLVEMLSEPHKSALAAWKSATDIVIIDTDSVNLSDNNILEGLGGKFQREGYGGKLWFVKGGYGAIERIPSINLTSSEVVEVELSGSGSGSGSDSTGPGRMKMPGMMGGLGSLAFQQGTFSFTLARPSRRIRRY
jgi:rhodanese-related sulfurtransferase